MYEYVIKLTTRVYINKNNLMCFKGFTYFRLGAE